MTTKDSQPVNPSMITVARESRGIGQTLLAEKIGASQARLSKIEAGLAATPSELLTRVSDVLGYPEDFFLQTDQIYGPSTSEFFHRKRQSTAAKVVERLHAILTIRRMHISRLLRAVDQLAPRRIEHIDMDEYESPEEVARKVRADWRLPRGPVKDLVRVIEAAGGIVVRFPFGTPKIDAISVWVPDLPPLFFINADMPADRQRMSLAHELCHIVAHATVRPHMEEEANRFAGEFLMPADDVRSQLREVTLHSLANLKPFWRVSMAALLKRAGDLGTINDSRKQSLWVQLSAKGYRKREPAELDFPAEVPRALRELLDLHYQKLGYSRGDLARLLALREPELDSYYGQHTSTVARKGLSLV